MEKTVIKNIQKLQYDYLNKLVWKWFCSCVPVSGRLLLEKAVIFSLQLGYNNFMASNGWLECFKAHHNISCAVLSGESADVEQIAVNDWEKRLDALLEGYELQDIFNADETGVFFRSMPEKSLVVRGEMCAGGKKSKDRLTLLLACSATGEKLRRS